MNKYNAKKTKCKQDHIHDSGDEAKYCNELMLLKKAGEIERYETQVRYDLIVNGYKIGFHKVDFVVHKMDYEKKELYTELQEFKGKRTEKYNFMLKVFKACYPEKRYKIIKKK